MSRTEDERNCRERKLKKTKLNQTLKLQGFRADEEEISRVDERVQPFHLVIS